MKILPLFLLLNCIPFLKHEKNIEYKIVEGYSLNYRQRGTVIFKTRKNFTEFWNNHCIALDNSGKRLSPPEIDFDTYMLAGIFMGERPTGGYHLSIEKITETKKAIKIYIKETAPEKNQIVITMLTYPYKLILLKKSTKPVEFIYVKKVE